MNNMITAKIFAQQSLSRQQSGLLILHHVTLSSRQHDFCFSKETPQYDYLFHKGEHTDVVGMAEGTAL